MTIDYIPFATGGGADVMSQADYVVAAPDGVSNGLADPTEANKSWRQSSMFAAALANIISAQLGGISVLDDGNLTNLINNLSAAISVLGASGVAQGFNAASNLRLSAAVGSNQLTISILGTNGSAPSATNPVTIPFRDVTIGTGDLVSRVITSALSFTIGSTNTMGVAANNQPFRLWVVAFDNGGTVCLGAINCSIAGRIFPLNEDALQTSDPSTSGGSTAGTYYANVSSITSKAIRILGYMEWSAGLATAGTWNALPTTIQLFGPGQKKPGETVQVAFNANVAGVTVTPTSPVNQFLVNGSVVLATSGGATGSASYKRGSTTLWAGSVGGAAGASPVAPATLANWLDNPYASGATAYTITVASATPSSPYVCVQEIMA